MNFSTCHQCGGGIQAIRFMEPERDRHNILTGRVRNAVSHLECENCLKCFIVDDSFDGEWYYPTRKIVD